MLKNNEAHYGSVTKFFHWTTALLIVGMLIFGYLLDDLHSMEAYNIHKLIGGLIFALVLLRILWNLHSGRPKLHMLPKWERVLAYSTEGLLYVCMVCMPLLGLLGTSFYGYGPHLFNINLGLPVTPNPELASFFMNLHAKVAIILIALIAFHVLGALKHFLIDKDRVLQKMLPFTQD